MDWLHANNNKQDDQGWFKLFPEQHCLALFIRHELPATFNIMEYSSY